MSSRLKKTIRPIGTTVVLSCLIWIYADQINNENTVELVTLQVAPQPGSDLVVEMQDPPTGQLQVTFAGPRADLDKFRREMGNEKFKYYVQPEEVKEDTLVKDSSEILGAILRKDYKTISVREVKPAQVTIFVDRLITVSMPVRVSTGTTKTTTPVIKPAEVKVTLSRSAYQSLYDVDKFLVVDIENELHNKVEDRAIDEDFALPQVVLGQPVTTDPTRVKIQLRVQQQFQTKSFAISQIEQLGPNDIFTKYRVDIRDPQITVELKGPAELINNLKPQNIIAYIRLDQEDTLRSWTTYFPRDVQFILPEGIKLNTDKITRQPGILFKLVELQTAAPPAPR
ncbi:MAG: hypothetical protein WC975_02145 [Phycisphaerae bacterium]